MPDEYPGSERHFEPRSEPKASGLPSLVLPRYTADIAPKGIPVLVAGGVAMKKTGGQWVSGMTDDPFTRELNWEPEWWAHIPQQNDTPPFTLERRNIDE